MISKTIQKFDGQSYYLCGRYFQRKGKRLHRTVWEYHNEQKVPKGYHVHHIDGNTSNNQIDNLALVTASEHLSGHMSAPERKEMARKTIQHASKAAAKWHGSEDGKRWHSKHVLQTWENKPYHKRICDWCGVEYQTRDLGHKSGQHFCCGKHRSLATQWRIRHEGDTNYPSRNR